MSRLERSKDTLQEGVESAAVHAGRIMAILTGAVRDVTHELGEFATDVFEMREASRRAEAAQAEPATHAEPAAQAQPATQAVRAPSP